MCDELATYLQVAAAAGALGTTACKFLVGIGLRESACLFQFNEVGAPEEVAEIPFVAFGSGQPIADPFLGFLNRVLWTGRKPTVAEGRLAAIWR